MQINRSLPFLGMLALAGCGGGTSSGDAITVAAAPAPVSTPNPTPTPTPTAAPSLSVVAFTTPEVAAEGSGAQNEAIAMANDGSPFQVLITDPDAPAAVSFEDLKLNGNETITARASDSVGSDDETITAQNSQGITTMHFTSATGEDRAVPSLGWSASVTGGTARLRLLETEDKPKTPEYGNYLGRLPTHARLLEVQLPGREVLQLIGTRAAASAVPISGVSYDGEAYGTDYDGSGQHAFIGDAVINVDTSRTSGQVSGTVYVEQFNGTGASPSSFKVYVVADLVNGAFVTRGVEVVGAGQTEYGTVTGAFYGTGDELGLVISAKGVSGSLVAGMICGKH